VNKKFYITTPIYYVNDIPHIGHAYTTIAADIIARYSRLSGKHVFFLTGTDEHGQKVENAAKETGSSPKEHSDLMVENFKKLWIKLNISNDAFIRTTDNEHVKTVQGLIQMLWDKREIEKKEYSGWYCTPDERFWTEKELIDGNCPDCSRPVERILEENYFFLMSKYHERLVKHIEDNSSYILPVTRRNEVLGFLKNNRLGDLCISRPKQRLSWGIILPFDKNFVTYVWFDALVNYFSATRYLTPKAESAKLGDFWWPASHHLVGKDILTTHAVYWSTMLMALNLPLPENIFAHGWWTVNGRKMSKSLGNVVDPNKLIDNYGADAFRYFLFREVPFGLDGDFSEEALVNRVNTDLANDLGNLLSRFLAMAWKYLAGIIDLTEVTQTQTISDEFRSQCVSAISKVMNDRHWAHLHFNIILEHIWDIVRTTNNHIAQTEPWKLAKNNPESLKDVMINIWNALKIIAILLYSFMPETAEKIWKQLGLNSLPEEAEQSSPETLSADKISGIFEWDWRPSYAIRVSKGEHLFPRIEKTKEEEKKKQNKGASTSHQPTKDNNPSNPVLMKSGMVELSGEKKEFDAEKTNVISINDLARVNLKIGKVLKAEYIKGSNKLINLQVDTGEKRQIVAGIGKVYSPDKLIGKKIVVVTNLMPANLMGVESNGMLLAATDSDGTPVIIIPEKDVKEGSKIR
jgi:methionyl-tRNA synthetase